jgi:predicted nucleic acid-binding protein
LNARVILLTSIQFNDALRKYRDFGDKEWGLVDCSSFQIMEKEQIREALTDDKHFQQAGFIPLLKENIS